ncbi:MAG TPA: cytochrome c biogenesis protein CcsA [Acidimicrobiales bacterium]|nr:cytochrome c biogenesis protein CcsA [Acidimicrobiales bacterium]
MTPRARLLDGLLGIAASVTLATTLILGLRLPPTAEQEDYSRLIAIHPAIAWTAYLAFGVMAIASALWLIPATRGRVCDRIAAASAEVGVVFTALMLVTGSIWGRPTWGVWWVWDARLTLSALMLALLLGYLALRRVSVDVERRSLVSAVTALAAVVVIPINHFAVTWWRTLHQGRSLANVSPGSTLDGEYIAVMLVGFVAMTLAYGWLLLRRYRIEALAEAAADEGLAAAIVERRREGLDGGEAFA